MSVFLFRSSLYYWAHYDFFNNTKFGTAVPDTMCDEEFVSWKPSSGYFRSPVNTLVYKRQATVTDPDVKSQPIICRYKFTTDIRLFARIVLKIESIKFKVLICFFKKKFYTLHYNFINLKLITTIIILYLLHLNTQNIK